MANETYGRWKVIRPLGKGGQGEVFKVLDTTAVDPLGQKIEELAFGLSDISSNRGHAIAQEKASELAELVRESFWGDLRGRYGALKIIHPSENPAEFGKALARMQREIDVYETVESPSLLKILDKNLDKHWIVTEFHEGGTLRDQIGRFKGDIHGALKAIRPIVSACSNLHEIKAVHRDVKPANIFIRRDGQLVLGDAGLVFFDDVEKSRISDTFENVGTRDYMPQWAMSQRVDEVRPSFDVFSLGKVLWAMVAGHPGCRLWYVHKDEYELEKMFPNDPNVRFARSILDSSVVQEEADCLKTATELLRLIDQAVSAMSRNGQPISSTVVRLCTVCGVGSYMPISEPVPASQLRDEISKRERFGLNPRGGTRHLIYGCDHCGHIQIFYSKTNDGAEFPKLPPAWRGSKNVLH